MTETMPRAPRAASAPTPALWWDEAAGRLVVVDQTRLPGAFVTFTPATVGEFAEAIRTMRVRGAPAIGVAAAYGLATGARATLCSSPTAEEAMAALHAIADELRATRPTAVNLGWALDHLLAVAAFALENGAAVETIPDLLAYEAHDIEQEDALECEDMGRLGAELIADGDALLTHCNAGALATAGIGTALAPIYTAHAAGKRIHVFVDETRPALQGARLTAWELSRAGVPMTLITDTMAASVMRRAGVRAVFVGADRIAANGDIANKIGTFGLAIIAHELQIPFYVVAPRSTIDLATPDGGHIPIEERAASEVTEVGGVRIAPEGVAVANPAFDVTPARYITAIITSLGVARAPYEESLPGFFSRDSHLATSREAKHEAR